ALRPETGDSLKDAQGRVVRVRLERERAVGPRPADGVPERLTGDSRDKVHIIERIIPERGSSIGRREDQSLIEFRSIDDGKGRGDLKGIECMQDRGGVTHGRLITVN